MKYILSILSFLFVLNIQAQVIIVDQSSKDTISIKKVTKDTTITVTKVISITTNEVTINKYKEPTIPIPVPDSTSDYLKLPVSNKINYSGRSNVVIENLRFENVTGAAIVLTNCTNVTIRNCFFNKATEEAISAEKCTSVLVEKNLFNGVATGVYALSSSNIRVINNQSLNPHVRPQGGRGNLTQFNGVSGTTNEVSNNVSVAWPNENNVEDHISLYNTINVIVRNNTLVGGGPSTSGSGIMTGDEGGSNQTIENNKLLSTGNAGIGIASGTNIKVTNNKIYGERTAVSNNPLYMWNQYAKTCANNSITGNFVNWTDKNGSKNNGWNAMNCANSVYDPSQNKTISLAEMGIPSDWNLLITFIKPDEVNKIRGK